MKVDDDDQDTVVGFNKQTKVQSSKPRTLKEKRTVKIESKKQKKEGDEEKKEGDGDDPKEWRLMKDKAASKPRPYLNNISASEDNWISTVKVHDI